MSILKLNTGGITTRCSYSTLLMIVIVAFMYSGVAAAQQHGAGVNKGCGPPVRICGAPDDPICDDSNVCTAVIFISTKPLMTTL